MAITLYTLGLSMRAIAKLFEVSPNAVVKWIKAFTTTHYEKPAPGDAILIELDEMWRYVTSKNKLLIWKVHCREAGEVIDWECGGRDKATLSNLMERLSKWKVELFCTDNWGVYLEATAVDQLYQSKSQAVYSERNNRRQRYCLRVSGESQ